jgi:hypothetical protein
MSGKPGSYKRKDVKEGNGIFAMHYLELLTSDAWLGQSVPCRRLVDYLEIEHLRHGGFENGRLNAPRVQLIQFGIGRNDVEKARSEAARRGLIEFRGGERIGPRNAAILYRLTFRKTFELNEFDKKVWLEPTHEWKRFKEVPTRKAANDPHLLVTVTDHDLAPTQIQNDPHLLVTVNTQSEHQKVTMTDGRVTIDIGQSGGKPPNLSDTSQSPFGDPSIYSGALGFQNPKNNHVHGVENFGPVDKPAPGSEAEAKPFSNILTGLMTLNELSHEDVGRLARLSTREVQDIQTGRVHPEARIRNQIRAAILGAAR